MKYFAAMYVFSLNKFQCLVILNSRELSNLFTEETYIGAKYLMDLWHTLYDLKETCNVFRTVYSLAQGLQNVS
jgi:hypothetical protein